MPEDITKVSVYLHEGVENYVERFVPRWKQANCAVAGPFWIDTTFANKGIGVQCVCSTLGIDPAQVMAFGDNYNDETMLDVVGVPYIMDNAAAPLRAKYKNHTPRPEDVLAQLLAQRRKGGEPMDRKGLEQLIFDTYSVEPDYPWMDTPESAVFRHAANRKWFALVTIVPRSKLGLSGHSRWIS